MINYCVDLIIFIYYLFRYSYNTKSVNSLIGMITSYLDVFYVFVKDIFLLDFGIKAGFISERPNPISYTVIHVSSGILLI